MESIFAKARFLLNPANRYQITAAVYSKAKKEIYVQYSSSANIVTLANMEETDYRSLLRLLDPAA